MSPETRRKAELIFNEIADLPPAEREQRLAAECSEDAALAEEVRGLLSVADGTLGNFLLSPPLAVAASEESDTPLRVGRYEIIKKVGEGGMGVVYEARQDNPRRTVALKLMRADLLAPRLLKRFEHEAQLLGRLQHPGIARIYDAGTADVIVRSAPAASDASAGDDATLASGATREPAALLIAQPYFAMEFVRGQTLTAYADERRLGTRQRLELLALVCDAVHYAHANGVIHRDLKPGNILVDEHGQPRVLDFGIARVTDGDAQTMTLRTDVGQLLGTLPYMSPEQVGGDPAEVDHLSDVYALGVIAWELLVGRLPYDVRRRPLAEAARIIREEEPARLSSHDRRLRGDVETIVAKTLEKNKTRRYGSAAELAADIRRYLHEEPIRARPASTAYQLRKLARRHRTLFVGLAATFVALLLGLIGTTYGLLRAERQRAAAETARGDAERASKTAAAINDFLLQKLLASPDPWVQGKDVRVADLLDQAAAQIDAEFGKQPELRAAVQNTLGLTYRRLGLLDQAEAPTRAAYETRLALLGPDHPDTLTSLHGVGAWQLARDRFAEARETLQRAYDARRRVLGPLHADTLMSLEELAATYYREGAFESAAQLSRQLVAERSATVGAEHADTIRASTALGWTLSRLGRSDEAETLFKQAVDACVPLVGENHPLTIAAVNGLATVYSDRGQPDLAEAAFRRSLAASRATYGDDHPDTLVALNGLANVLRSRGNPEEAEPLYRQVLAVYRSRLGEEHQWTLIATNNLAACLSRAGKADEALLLLEQNLATRRRVLGEKHPDVAESLEGLAISFSRRGQPAQAVPYYRAALAIYREAFGAEHSDTANVMANLTLDLLKLREYAAALEILPELVGIERKLFGPEHQYTLATIANLVDALLGVGRADEAEPLARELLALREKNNLPKHWQLAAARGLLGAALRAQRRYTEAEPLLLAAYTELMAADVKPPTRVAAILREIVALYEATGQREKAAEFAQLLTPPTTAPASQSARSP